MALLCAWLAGQALLALAAGLRARRLGLDSPLPAPRLVLPAAAAVALLTAAALSAYDAWDNVVIRYDQPVARVSWGWMAFDLLLPLVGLLLLRALRERDRALQELARQAVTDPLTELRNRRGFMNEAAVALARCARAGQPATVLVLDLDRFKSINDRHGHAAGDAVLRGLAAVIRSDLRAGDLPGRLGGEEFALLLPGSDIEAAVATAERLRTALPEGVPHPGGGRVTASFGVAPVVDSMDAALAAADEALYAAKEAGRDRVMVAGREIAAV